MRFTNLLTRTAAHADKLTVVRCMTQPKPGIGNSHPKGSQYVFSGESPDGAETMPDIGSLNLGGSFTNVPGGTANWTFSRNINYAPASGTATITISKATPVITWNNPADITYGTALGAAQLGARVWPWDWNRARRAS